MIDKAYFPNPVNVPGARLTDKSQTSAMPTEKSAFAGILDDLKTREGVKFSLHARERLRERGICLSETDLEKLRDAVEMVAQKGGKESLVLLKDSALVVSVKNRTVVTVMDRNKLGNNVITNIDSAVLFP